MLTQVLQEIGFFFALKHLHMKNMNTLTWPKPEIARIHHGGEGDGFINKVTAFFITG